MKLYHELLTDQVIYGCLTLLARLLSQCHRLLDLDQATKLQRMTVMNASPTVSAPKREKDPKKRIVISGMGLVSVFGNDVDGFYDKLLRGTNGVGMIDRFNTSELAVKFAGQIHEFWSEGYVDQKSDRRLDDCWRYCLVAGKKALESANLGPQQLISMDRSRIGAVVGAGVGGLTIFSTKIEKMIKRGYHKLCPFLVPCPITNMGSALLAIDIGLMGPSYSISTACATSNCCFLAAANHIRKGEVDVMIAGGTEAPIIPIGIAGFSACRALSLRNAEPDKASRPWDKARDGFVMGEGSGILVMESLEHARIRGANIIAEYLGGAITCDAHHVTEPRPDVLGITSCITRSMEDAGVSPEEVNYVNAHATSTPAGDITELNAIKEIFQDTSEIKINATKNLEPEVTIDTVPNVKKYHEINVAISNSFGFGGHNSVVVFAPFQT
ncbi:hypothetical protein IEQ34_004171 [Dendrobium chrysotoxum]|uniref:3-oxoacyl-[acyl-carrier-protein] synthase n=1 Tax=Dendrobium chrysotoxum TaxID=161865 RepID=A0AAV7HFV9_DENCH|nr:hypothetical protein IEQ34_004171 [Dendrobium chrysotoxum]